MENKNLWLKFLNGKTVGKSYQKKLLSKYETNIFTIDEVKNEQELVWYIRNPFIVIDVDNLDNAFKLLEILKAASLKFIAYFSKSKGMHFIFKTQTALRYRAGKCWLDIPLEWKSWGSKKIVHVTIKEENKFRKFINHVDENEIDELPFWLHKNDKVSDLYMCEENDFRNEKLFKLISSCMKNVNCKNWFQFQQYIHLINDYIFKKPLSKNELDNTILRNEIEVDFTKEKEDFKKETTFFHKGRFLVDVFIEKFLENYNVYIWNDQLWFYDDCIYNSFVYTNDYKVFMRQALLLCDTINKLHREEIYQRLELRVQDLYKNPDTEFIGLKNGLFNFYTNEFREFTPDIFCMKKINVEWDENYINGNFEHEVPGKVLDLVSSFNILVKNFLLDTIANVFFYTSNKHELVVFLEGSGGNGKSSFFQMIMNFFGRQNTTSLSLHNFKNRFNLAMLNNSMLNISSEAKSHNWADAENFKSIISGDLITVEEKFKRPRNVKIYSKLFIAANKLNPLKEEDHALERRLAVVECKKSIRKDVKKDVTIKDRLEKDEEGISKTLLKMVLPRIKKLIENGNIFLPPIVKKFTFSKSTHANEKILTFFCWLKSIEINSTIEDCLVDYFENSYDLNLLPSFENETDIKELYNEYILFFYNNKYNEYLEEKDIIGFINFKKYFQELYKKKYTLVEKRIKNKRYYFIWKNENLIEEDI